MKIRWFSIVARFSIVAWLSIVAALATPIGCGATPTLFTSGEPSDAAVANEGHAGDAVDASCAMGPEAGRLDHDGGSEADAAPDPFLTKAQCTSGLLLNSNGPEGPTMRPGLACVGCHEEQNAATGDPDAPIFAFAGTVFPTGHEPNDCQAIGSLGARVEITDALGRFFSEDVNESGNFFSEDAPFAYPYHARVVFEGRARSMVTPQIKADCNGCHTQAGAENAPGRIVLP